MEQVFDILAGLGILLMIAGRILLLRDTGDIGRIWRVALRFFPGADIILLMRCWDIARRGAATSLAGLICLMPSVGMHMYEEFGRRKGPLDLVSSNDGEDYAPSEYVETDEEYDDDGEVLSAQGALQEQISLKAEKIAQLNGYLGHWYPALNQRRQTVKNEGPEALAQYNVDAAAYQQLLAVVKEETAELEELKRAAK